MVRKLRNRPRADNQTNQTRRQGGRWARRVYLVMLAALFLAVGNYVWGDKLLMRADGIVLRDRVTIAETSPVRVVAVNVRAGQQVVEGDVLVQVESAEILERIADLTLRHAELVRREAELRSRSARADALHPLAESHAAELSANIAQLQIASSNGVVTGSRYADAMREHFEAQSRLADLVTDATALETEITALVRARRSATRALDDLISHYGGGETIASVSGTVGSAIPAVGEVYPTAEPLLTIHIGQPFILAYLPTIYLFPMEEGMEVQISDGRNTTSGRIEEILSISESLPPEFRTAFRPAGRQQLARIVFDDFAAFPALATVRITTPLPTPQFLQ